MGSPRHAHGVGLPRRCGRRAGASDWAEHAGALPRPVVGTRPQPVGSPLEAHPLGGVCDDDPEAHCPERFGGVATQSSGLHQVAAMSSIEARLPLAARCPSGPTDPAT